MSWTVTPRCSNSTGKPGWIKADMILPYHSASDPVCSLHAVTAVERPDRDGITVMIFPIGTFLTRMDAALTGSMGGIIASMTSAMATPIAAAAVIYYAVQGLKLANGDPTPLQNFVPQLIRVGTVIWLSSNLSAFNQWVTGIFFTGLPNALAAAIANSTGSTGNSVNATAAIFDNIWSQIWVVVGTVWAQAGFSTMGAVAAIAGVMAAIIGTVGLLLLALVYECARMVLAVIVCLAPAIIGCAMFDATRPIFERAVGKVVALIILQTSGLIVLQILLMGDQWFIAQATTASMNALGSGSAQGEEIQTLIALVVWFIAGAFAIYSLPAIAYSIGSGIAVSGPSLLLDEPTRAIAARRGTQQRRAAPAAAIRPVERYVGAAATSRVRWKRRVTSPASSAALHRRFDPEITPCAPSYASSYSAFSPVVPRTSIPMSQSRLVTGCRRIPLALLATLRSGSSRCPSTHEAREYRDEPDCRAARLRPTRR